MNGPGFMLGNSVPPSKEADDLIKETTTRDFLRDVLEASRTRPVLVDFWAPWCGPCKQLTPLLEKAVRAAKGAVSLVKMNIDLYPEIAGQLGIQSIPAVIAFVDGRPLDGFMGALPESQIAQFIARIAPPAEESAAASLVESGDLLLNAQAYAEAAESYRAALALEPALLAAHAGLIRALTKAGRLSEARAAFSALGTEERKSALISGAEAELSLAEKAEGLGDAAAFAARLDRDPKDHEARLALALALATQGDKKSAVDHLIESVRQERGWQDEAARKQLLQFFDSWGAADPMTLYGRRRLSSVLFS